MQRQPSYGRSLRSGMAFDVRFQAMAFSPELTAPGEAAHFAVAAEKSMGIVLLLLVALLNQELVEKPEITIEYTKEKIHWIK